MKVECLVENLEKALSIVTKALPTHAQIPVLSNILVEATEKGFFLTATDLEFGAKIKIAARVDEAGAVTIPGRQFAEVIHSLPKDKVVFHTERDAFILSSRSNTISFQTISREEFPDLVEKSGERACSFTPAEFRDIFVPLVFTVSTDNARPQLTGILFMQREDTIDFVATDGYRLSLKTLPQSLLPTTGRGLILSSRVISEVLALRLETSSTIDMYVLESGNQVVFEAGDVMLVGRLIDGEFPAYQKVIPTDFKTRFEVDRDELSQALRLVSVFAKENANIARLKISDGTLYFYARTQGVGEGEIKTDVEQEGESNEIAFNVKYLLDLLKNTESKKLVGQLNSALEPGVFRLSDDKSFLHVVMPVRVQE
jgi:DNA polymerase III subunit beta